MRPGGFIQRWRLCKGLQVVILWINVILLVFLLLG